MSDPMVVEVTPQRGPDRSLLPLFALTLGLSMGYGVVFSMIAEFRDRFDFTGSEIGLIVGSGFLSGFVAQVALSRLADRGYAFLLLRIGAASAAVAMVWMAAGESLVSFVGARLLLGVGAGAVAPTARRLVLTAAAGTDLGRGEALGRLAAFDIAGFVAGPLLGSVLLLVAGFRWPFIVLAGVYLAALAGTWLLDPSLGDVSTDPSRTGGSVRDFLAQPAFRRALALGAAFYTTIGTFEAAWALLYSDLGAAQWVTGVTISLFVVPMALLASRGGTAAERHGPYATTRVSVPVAMVCMLAYGAIGLSGDGETTMVLAIAATSVLAGVHSIADAFTLPAMQLAVADASPDEHVAAGQGILSAFGLLVALAATLGASVLYEVSGTLAAFGVPVVAMAFAVWVAQRPGSAR